MKRFLIALTIISTALFGSQALNAQDQAASGFMCDYGTGITRNFSEVASLYRKAVEQRHPQSTAVR